MSNCQEWAEAFTIFAKYEIDGRYLEVAAEHDIVYAGPMREETSAEDAARLRELGWHEDDLGKDGWAKFV